MASTFPAIEQRTAQRRDWFDFAFFWDISLLFQNLISYFRHFNAFSL